MGRAHGTDRIAQRSTRFSRRVCRGRRSAANALSLTREHQGRAPGGTEPHSAGGPRRCRRVVALAGDPAARSAATGPRLDLADLLCADRRRPAQLPGGVTRKSGNPLPGESFRLVPFATHRTVQVLHEADRTVPLRAGGEGTMPGPFEGEGSVV